MGLDAIVYCNCYETGRLRTPPPEGIEIFVEKTGQIACKSDDLKQILAVDAWLLNHACEHSEGVIIHRRIGNIALVALLTRELESESLALPVILGKIIHSGTHCGDLLSPEDVAELRIEIETLKQFRTNDPETQKFVDEFAASLSELADASAQAGKPICF